MSLSDIAAIKNFFLTFNLLEPPFSSAGKLIPISQTLTFSHVTSVTVKEGTYTPNNDWEWLMQNIPVAEAPNFLFIQSLVALNLSVRAAGNLFMSAVPVDQAFFLLMPPGAPPISDVYIEGRSGQSVFPMPNTPCPFFFVGALVTRQ